MHPTILAVIASFALGSTALADTQTGKRDATSAARVVDAPPPNYADSMARLQEAAQRLREAIQAMAQHPAGSDRNRAIRSAHEALLDAQQAMIHLPPDLYTSEGKKADPKQAMKRLEQAAQNLRESVQAMAQQPSGPQRNAAAQKAREAILETHQAMVALPPEMRAQAGTQAAGAPAAGAAATGGAAHGKRKNFSALDRDNDGYLSRMEAAADADAKQKFERLDRNNDAKLSRSEWEAGVAPAAGGAGK